MSELASPRRTREMVGGLSMDTITRKVAAGTFPKPVVLGRDKNGRATRIAWVLAEVQAWVDETILTGRRRTEDGASTGAR